VKTVQTWVFLGVIAGALIQDRAPLRAQPANEPAQTDDDPDPTDGDSDSMNDDSIEIDNADHPWSRGVSAEARRAARKLFLEGNRLFRTPLFAKAAEHYTAALRKWKHPAFHFNLALAQLNLGKEIEARENLERALMYGKEPLGEEQFREATKQLEEVKRQIGRIRVACQTAGAEVTLDGVTLFIGPGSHEGWVEAKTHELTAKKAGYLSEARRVTVKSGKVQDIELKLVTLTQATDASRRWAVWKPWAVVAAGGAIAAAGGGLHVLASRNFNQYDRKFLELDCVLHPSTEMPGCLPMQITPDLHDQLTFARREQSLAVGAYVVGGSAILAGAVLLYLNRPQTAEQRAGSPFAGDVALVPAVSDDSLGILVSISR